MKYLLYVALIGIGGALEYARTQWSAPTLTCETLAAATRSHTDTWLRNNYPTHWPEYGSQSGLGEIRTGKHHTGVWVPSPEDAFRNGLAPMKKIERHAKKGIDKDE